MKQKIRIAFFVVLILIFLGSFACAEGYPESEHDYPNNADITYTYTHPTDAEYLKVTFSEDTQFESGYDFLYVIDANDVVSKYSGEQLAGEEVLLKGNSFSLRLTSDGSRTYYGFRITEIIAMTQEEFEAFMNAKRFTVSESGELTDYNGSDADVVIPNVWNGVTITSIGDSAFSGCINLTSVTIGDSVTSIGNYAFNGCSGLTNITIPDSVTSIGNYAFNGCSGLTNITIPDSVTSIGNYAFDMCISLTSITIGDSVTSIDNSAFEGCSSLTEVTIPGSMTNIKPYTFSGCSSLTEVTIPDSVTSIGFYAFCGCSSLTEVTIPDSITSIVIGTFKDCSSLTEVTIPDGVTSIGNNAFWGCSSLTEIEIPDSVTSIGTAAFYRCSGLTEITIPDSVTGIGNSAFSGCSSLTEVTIGKGVTAIGKESFKDCSALSKVDIPAAVEKISDGAFTGCGLEQIRFLGMETVVNGTLCDNDAVIVCHSNSGVEVWAKDAGFTVVNFRDFALLDHLTVIDEEAFAGIGAETVTIPESVTKIGARAFADCDDLIVVVIEGNPEIDPTAFDDNVAVIYKN